MGRFIFVDRITYALLLTLFETTKDGLMSNHFDHSAISGSESFYLPVLSEYRSTYAEVRGMLMSLSALIERDSEDIQNKSAAFFALDSKLGASK